MCVSSIVPWSLPLQKLWLNWILGSFWKWKAQKFYHIKQLFRLKKNMSSMLQFPSVTFWRASESPCGNTAEWDHKGPSPFSGHVLLSRIWLQHLCSQTVQVTRLKTASSFEGRAWFFMAPRIFMWGISSLAFIWTPLLPPFWLPILTLTLWSHPRNSCASALSSQFTHSRIPDTRRKCLSVHQGSQSSCRLLSRRK